MTRSKSQRAYELIKELIVAQKIHPGERLVLAGLAHSLGMSVVPVREAIRRLEAEGIVVYEKNVGARVARVNRQGYLDAMQALAIVEAAATGLAAPHLSDRQLAEARGINELIAASLDDFDPGQFAARNQEFHRLLYDQCPNTYLVEMVDEAWSQLALVREPQATFTKQRAHASVAEHEHILTLIETGAPEAEIEAAVRDHRMATRRATQEREQIEC